MSEEEKLHEMVQQVEKAKERLAQLKGERKQLFQQLQATGAKTLDQAKKMIKDLEAQVEDDKNELQKLLSDLEKKFDWEDAE